MSYTRREFGKLALAGLPAAAIIGHTESIFGAFAQAKPNSLINGVQIGTIRSLAAALRRYIFVNSSRMKAVSVRKAVVCGAVAAKNSEGYPTRRPDGV